MGLPSSYKLVPFFLSLKVLSSCKGDKAVAAPPCPLGAPVVKVELPQPPSCEAQFLALACP